MRARTDPNRIYQDPTYADLLAEDLVLLGGLRKVADRAGRLVDHPYRLLAQLPNVAVILGRTGKKVTACLRRLVVAGAVTRYQVAGQSYLAIANWDQDQRPSRMEPESTLPPPPDPRIPPQIDPQSLTLTPQKPTFDPPPASPEYTFEAPKTALWASTSPTQPPPHPPVNGLRVNQDHERPPNGGLAPAMPDAAPAPSSDASEGHGTGVQAESNGRSVTPVPKPKDLERSWITAHPLFNALVAIPGIGRPAGDRWSLYGKAIKTLDELGATPEQVPRAAANYPLVMGTKADGTPIPLTLTSLVNNWNLAVAGRITSLNGSSNGHETETHRRDRLRRDAEAASRYRAQLADIVVPPRP